MEKLTQGAPRLQPQLLHFIMFLTLQGGHFNAFGENGLTLGTSLASARPEDLIKEAHARPIKYQTTGSMTQAASLWLRFDWPPRRVRSRKKTFQSPKN